MERPTACSRPSSELDWPAQAQVELDEILDSALDEAIRAGGAERGCLFMDDPATGQPQLHSSRGPGKLSPASRTAIEHAWRSGEALLVARADEYPEPAGTANSPGGSFLCVPLAIQEQQPGVLYLETSLDARPFSRDDLALAVASVERTWAAPHEPCSKARSCQRTIEQERQRLARELHDAISYPIPVHYWPGGSDIAQAAERDLSRRRTHLCIKLGF